LGGWGRRIVSSRPSWATQQNLISKKKLKPVPVAHTCNPSYLDGREAHGLKPAQGNSSRDPILKKSHHKKGLVMWLKVKALSSNKQTNKNTINP
jgi:hypothetical protein